MDEVRARARESTQSARRAAERAQQTRRSSAALRRDTRRLLEVQRRAGQSCLWWSVIRPRATAEEGAGSLRPAARPARRSRDGDTWALLREYCRTRDMRLRNELVDRLESFVRRQVDRFTPAGGNSRDDLMQVGYMGLIAALERFDPSSGVQFVTFAAPTINGVIKHYLRDQGWMVKAPRRLRELAMSLPRLRASLESRLGRVPSIPEISAAAGVSEERLIEAMDFNLLTEPASLDVQHTDPEGGTCSLADAVGAPDPEMLEIDDREAIRRALDHLSERHRALVVCRYYRNYSQAKTAECLGISQMHVSRLERQALELLRGLLADTYGAAERPPPALRRARRGTPTPN